MLILLSGVIAINALAAVPPPNAVRLSLAGCLSFFGGYASIQRAEAQPRFQVSGTSVRLSLTALDSGKAALHSPILLLSVCFPAPIKPHPQQRNSLIDIQRLS